ncbi:MAG: hypothetical protein BroJett011_42990 [Chloroflexota bacterium]|nr:MAG: hypothetical protein BroJett011_42990 [Chloroflexota bacterium]
MQDPYIYSSPILQQIELAPAEILAALSPDEAYLLELVQIESVGIDAEYRISIIFTNPFDSSWRGEEMMLITLEDSLGLTCIGHYISQTGPENSKAFHPFNSKMGVEVPYKTSSGTIFFSKLMPLFLVIAQLAFQKYELAQNNSEEN